MRVLRWAAEDGPRLGLLTGGKVADVTAATGLRSMRELLAGGLDGVREVSAEPTLELGPLHLLPPVGDPVHVFGVGMNTHSHWAEVAFNRPPDEALPRYPRLFFRSPLGQVGHGENLVVPSVSRCLDYEGELAVVIGREARFLSEEDALDAVAGYSCFNDGSLRDFQTHTNQSTAGKIFPRSGGFGPWIITPDEAPPLDQIVLTTRVNGEVRQSMKADDWIFSVPQLLVYMSKAVALQPGDVLLTGSAAGSGGVTRTWLRPGDIVEVEIDGVGLLRTGVEPESLG